MKQILFVDDNSQACLLTKIYLEKDAFHVHVCTNTEKARKILAQKPIDCIITDIGLPGENGIDFYKWLQKSPEYKHLPVLFVSAHAVGFDEVLMEHRSNFLSKPIFYPELIDRLNTLLSGSQKSD